MNSNVKILLLILFCIFFFWIYYNYHSFILRSYHWVSGFPKLLIIFITVTIIFAPTLLRNNKLVYICKDFLPDSISKKLDKINEYSDAGNTGNTSNTGNISTSKIRKVSEQLKKIVASQQKWHCKGCNNVLDATYEIDHIISLEDSGNNSIQNLQALCRNCHGKKTMQDNIKRRYPNGNIRI